jgi:hypothetical protein
MDGVPVVEALYYPGAQFASVPWLKAALLYWEGVLRLVPDGYIPEDSDEVRELVAAGLVRNQSPTPFREMAGVRFEERLAVSRSRKGSAPEPAPSEGAQFETVFLTELDERLVKDLRSQKLLEIQGACARLPAEVARRYRCTLACVAGEELAVAPMTDGEPSDVAAQHVGRLRRLAAEAGALPVNGFAWARLALPFPSPEVVASLSPERLVDIRQKYARQRRAFRELVQQRATAIFKLPSVEAIRSHLQDFANEIDEELKGQRHALRVTRAREAWALLGVSAPLSIGAALATLGAPPLVATVGGVGSIGLGIVNWVLERDFSRQVHSHYLLSLEATLHRFHFGTPGPRAGGEQAADSEGSGSS